MKKKNNNINVTTVSTISVWGFNPAISVWGVTQQSVYGMSPSNQCIKQHPAISVWGATQLSVYGMSPSNQCMGCHPAISV